MTQARNHIVLVPGFAGFDALGQIEYYAGTTPVFRRWQGSGCGVDSQQRARAALHYFDNAPSASVTARATRLRGYLAKRIARNEIQSGDAIALVGHSTGGLDIRSMVSSLDAELDADLFVDLSARDLGAASPARVRNRDLLAMIRRVVFISTPHLGTNLADHIDRLGTLSRLCLRAVKYGMALTRAVPARVSQTLLDALSFDFDSLLALLDAYREADEDAFLPTSSEAAQAREAHAQFTLWLDNMIADFQVIKDLKTRPDPKTTRQPEGSNWPKHISTRSYATVGGYPFEPASPGTDVLYRLLYKVSGAGQFRAPVPAPAAPRWLEPPARPRPLTIESNDGIVNTLSMYFEGGGDTYLVSADHGDVIGHYRRTRAVQDGGRGGRSQVERRPGHRRFASYDFFKSGSGFSEATFVALWNQIFEFCLADTAVLGLPVASNLRASGSD